MPTEERHTADLNLVRHCASDIEKCLSVGGRGTLAMLNETPLDTLLSLALHTVTFPLFALISPHGSILLIACGHCSAICKLCFNVC